MKKITIFMCVILMALALNAQEKIMFTHLKNGEVLSTPISQIDSVTFGTGGDNEPGVWINGIYWAKCNVNKPGFFTAKPEDFGMFYQWGSKVGWSSTDPLEASDGIHSWRNLSETGNVWKAEKDPCPTGWRVPTKEEFESLVSSGSVWKKKNDIDGRFFGNEKLFLPAAGYRHTSDGVLGNVGYGNYWSSIPDTNDAYYLNFYEHNCYISDNYKTYGNSVRCVKK